MQCPYCGSEMRDGSIFSIRLGGIMWIPKDKQREQGGYWDSSLKPYDGLWFCPPFDFQRYTADIAVCYCCRKGIMDIDPAAFDDET